MNKDQYKEALKHAQKLEFRVKDLIDDRMHTISQSLMRESKQLVDLLENYNNPRSLEVQVKKIMQLIHHANQDGDTVMDHRHANGLHQEYEHFQMSLRKFENY